MKMRWPVGQSKRDTRVAAQLAAIGDQEPRRPQVGIRFMVDEEKYEYEPPEWWDEDFEECNDEYDPAEDIDLAYLIDEEPG